MIDSKLRLKRPKTKSSSTAKSMLGDPKRNIKADPLRTNELGRADASAVSSCNRNVTMLLCYYVKSVALIANRGILRDNAGRIGVRSRDRRKRVELVHPQGREAARSPFIFSDLTIWTDRLVGQTDLDR
jgi:hypothetical protein